MRIKKGFLLRTVADTNIVVPVSQNALDFKGMLSLNETGAFLWKRLEKECTKEELLSAMLEEYEVEKEAALEDIEVFLDKVRSFGALEDILPEKE